MRVLLVENNSVTPLGQIGVALDEAGASVDICRAYAGDPLPADERGHDALIVMGGPQNALDDALHPYLPELARLMRRFTEAERSVLGVCLGSQILARAHGARNLVGATREFGWCPVALTEAGRSDPVLSAATDTFAIFQWHSDTFTLPESAVRLATNATAENQAFRIGRAAYGTQFHLEVNRAVVDLWADRFPDHIEAFAPGWLERRRALAEAHGESAEAAGLAFARAWIATIG